MPDHRDIPGPRPHWLRPMMGDIQFWIPLVVLVGGLLLLKWVA
jgi:hypothetical protein